MQESEHFREKLELLKKATIQKICATDENIRALNLLRQSEEIEFGSVASLAHIDKNLFDANAKLLAEINTALEKIDNGEYGKCEMCGEDINAERLEIKPHARFCIKCREIFEAQNTKKRSAR